VRAQVVLWEITVCHEIGRWPPIYTGDKLCRKLTCVKNSTGEDVFCSRLQTYTSRCVYANRRIWVLSEICDGTRSERVRPRIAEIRDC